MHFKICPACDANYAVVAEAESCPNCRSVKMERTLKHLTTQFSPPESAPPPKVFILKTDWTIPPAA
jgi:Zn-finger nucleic acid-binding protein